VRSSTNPPSDRIVTVGVPVPGLGLLSYRVPSHLSPPHKGARVRVPLGARTVVGCVVTTDAAPAPAAVLRDVIEVLDEQPFLPPVVVDLALWVGEYYASGPGDALAMALPPAARGGRRTAFRTVERAHVLEHTASVGPRGSKQRAALDLLRARAQGLTLPELLQAGIGVGTIRSLARLGLVGLGREIVERDPFALVRGEDGGRSHWTVEIGRSRERELTIEQRAALRRLEEAVAARDFRTVLLQGVTGSGKTELYLRLAGLVRDAGRRVLVLVPEIGLTPVVAGLFRARFGTSVAIQHSGLSAGERHDQWHRIWRGEVSIVVGTRSAVFAPLEMVGLIVVDEEHDGSYKQEEAPRYNGRDVAVVRGRMEQALVVLGSATPSLESAANAGSGRYERLVLTRRIFDRPLAEVQIVDMRREYADHGPDVILSAPLTTALQSRLEKGEQAVVLLNRRGFATVIFCRQCGASLECPHCSVALTYHRAARRVRCHYCNYSAAVPARCGTCGGEYLEQSGFGTERVEAEVRARFPEARVARVDRDTIRRRGAMARVLTEMARGGVDVLVGTQMIAKGHDFPAVTLAGVIAADVGLGLADFRASERTFQLLTQVVGRAGRGEVRGEAIIQTLYPDHYAIRTSAAQDYAAFFDREMEFRSKMQYPPAVGLINVVTRSRSLETAMAGALALVKLVRGQGTQARVIGPAPAALSKIKDQYRAQFFVKGTRRSQMREAIERALDQRPDLKRHTIVDVDPMNVI
jgi:primosomal protein N' (replication factor Y)